MRHSVDQDAIYPFYFQVHRTAYLYNGALILTVTRRLQFMFYHYLSLLGTDELYIILVLGNALYRLHIWSWWVGNNIV